MLSNWKLTRKSDGHIFKLNLGENKIGRSFSNNIQVENNVVSRTHCIIIASKDEASIKDCQTTNGTFVGEYKLCENKAHKLKCGDIISLGVDKSNQTEKLNYKELLFTILNDEIPVVALASRICFENEIIDLDSESEQNDLHEECDDVDTPMGQNKAINIPIHIISDSDIEKDILQYNNNVNIQSNVKTNNLNEVETKNAVLVETRNYDRIEESSFVKEEYNISDDDIECFSDDEDDAWAVRLSQSLSQSPGKSLSKQLREDNDTILEDLPDIKLTGKDVTDSGIDGIEKLNSDDEDTYSEDLIIIPDIEQQMEALHMSQIIFENENNEGRPSLVASSSSKNTEIVNTASTSGFFNKNKQSPSTTKLVPIQPLKRTVSKAFTSSSYLNEIPQKKRKKLLDNQVQTLSSEQKAANREERNRRLKEIANKEREQKEKNKEEDDLASKRATTATNVKCTNVNRGNFLANSTLNICQERVQNESDNKNKNVSGKSSNTSFSEDHAQNKLKDNLQASADLDLKDVITKNIKSSTRSSSHRNNRSKSSTQSNEGKASSDSSERNKHRSRSNSNQRSTSKRRESNSSGEAKNKAGHKSRRHSSEKCNRKSNRSHNRSSSKNKLEKASLEEPLKDNKLSKNAETDVETESNSADVNRSILKKSIDDRIPLKDVAANVHSNISRTEAKNNNQQGKTKNEKKSKKVTFSTDLVTVKEFEIEPFNKMKKVSECKATLIQSHFHRLSPQRKFLAFVLRWNSKWLEEQIAIKTPPNVLPHSHAPMSMCHAFQNHSQYERIMCDLLLMEVWESITQDYMKKREQPFNLELRLDIPPVISQDKIIPINFSVNLSVPKNSKMPRTGELMMIQIESPIDQQMVPFKHFCYVDNVRMLTAPRNNANHFLSISLVTVNGQSMSHVQRGARLLGKSLGYIKNELVLMEAVEHLRWSQLDRLILAPEPEHFADNTCAVEMSQWTDSLNPSQLEAVKRSVSAALGKEPTINMVQGPPGTGKSSVICSIVMSYFYSAGRRQSGRGKILVCATSNAAVDELVLRLLNIRQSLPSAERFRMVRVGRPEAMHPRAFDVSSGRLALQNAAAARGAAPKNGFAQDEVNWLRAKLNSTRNQLEARTDPAAAPALLKRIADLELRIARVSKACDIGGEPTREELAEEEVKIISGADIVVTTLGSVANHKLKCLVDRIALCIVDEAGQAIEAETLMPLMLRVTKMTLVGDHRQLPGFINSQEAKKYGLGDSLFSRLLMTVEDWQHNPVCLLDVQYRMHPAISLYPNRAFYNGRVKDCVKVRSDLPLKPYCMVFIASEARSGGDSCANTTEAWGVARLAAELARLAHRQRLSVAVITPYVAQKDTVMRCLATLLDKESGTVEVNTVDSFQGQERDIVLVSLARSQGVGFLTDPGRVNVMLTRARHALFVCLNPYALLRNDQWRSLMEDARQRRCCLDLPSRTCRPVTAEAAKMEPILPLLYK